MYRPDAVDDALGLLPIGLKWGRVGTFHLNVPWNALGARPLTVTLRDITLVFGLLDEDGSSGGGTNAGKIDTQAWAYYYCCYICIM